MRHVPAVTPFQQPLPNLRNHEKTNRAHIYYTKLLALSFSLTGKMK